MKKPTKEQINEWLEKEASQHDLKDIMLRAKDKEIRDKAEKLFNWEETSQYYLGDIMLHAKDKEIRDKAKSYLKVDVRAYIFSQINN